MKIARDASFRGVEQCITSTGAWDIPDVKKLYILTMNSPARLRSGAIHTVPGKV